MSAPLLLECDLNGRIVWMSDRTRATLGDAETICATFGAEELWSCSSFRLTRVWTARNRMLLNAEILGPTNDAPGIALQAVQSSFVRHYFQLMRAERHLTARARQLRGTGGASAIRQVELERQRLGRELHTGVGQLLAAIRMQLEIIAAQLKEPPLGVLQALGRISTLAADALEQVRTISKRLHPPEWQRMPLESAIRQLWENSGIPERYDSTIDLHRLPVEPGLEVKTLLYRATQEAFSNLVRHARASRITISLEPRGSQAVLTIWDNGPGFDVKGLLAGPASLRDGIGLRTIRDQSAAIGGKMEMESGPNGTKLVVTVPYSPNEPQAR